MGSWDVRWQPELEVLRVLGRCRWGGGRVRGLRDRGLVLEQTGHVYGLKLFPGSKLRMKDVALNSKFTLCMSSGDCHCVFSQPANMPPEVAALVKTYRQITKLRTVYVPNPNQ